MSPVADAAPLAGDLRGLIDTQAARYPRAAFLIDPVAPALSLSYAGLATRVRAVARWLDTRGIAPGESVAYAFGNGVESAVWILGIAYAGRRAVAVNLVAGPAVVRHVLEHSQSRLVISRSADWHVVDEAIASSGSTPPIVLIDEIDLQSPASSSELGAGATPAPGSSSDALLMYTSGTTGRPKGVLLSHANLLAGGVNVARAHALSASDRALCVLPLFHINGLCVTLFGPLVSGGSVVVPARFSASSFWHWIAAHRCSWFSVVPTQVSYLLHAPASESDRAHAPRFGRCASSPLSPEVHRDFEGRFGVPLIETMGLTETAARILSNPLPPGTRKLGSPGVAVGCELRVIDRALEDVPTCEEGELLIRGANVMQCYFRDEAATADALLPGGWLRTGDLVRQDAAGYVYVTGRLKELIIKGGENIAPREIDEALYRHPAVVEAAAFPVPCADHGQRVEAAVMIDSSVAGTVSEAELVALCERHVGAFKAPGRVHFLEVLPKGPSGKIQRSKLAALVHPVTDRSVNPAQDLEDARSDA